MQNARKHHNTRPSAGASRYAPPGHCGERRYEKLLAASRRGFRPIVMMAVALAFVVAGLPAPARAAFPGTNGRIVFSEDPVLSKPISLFSVNPDGTALSELGGGTQPAWSPDGTKIAFVAPDAGGDLEIFTANPDGSERMQLTHNAVDEHSPGWAPDGTRIAFDSDRDQLGPVSTSDIYLINSDGTGETRLTDHPLFDRAPVWAPDGTKIAFATNRDGNFELYTMDARTDPPGGSLTRLTINPLTDLHPDWSPDGTKIAFDRGVLDSRDIWVMNAGGGGEEPLTEDPDDDEEPAWSPDGTKIAFASERNAPIAGVIPNGPIGDIFVMNADGSDERRLIASDFPSGVSPDWGTAEPLPRPGSIAGTVSGGNGNNRTAIEGATVDCGAAGSATTGVDGGYRLTSVPPDTYSCTASAPGFEPATQSVSVTSGEETIADFTLRKAKAPPSKGGPG